jgi:hypothetical protein
MSLRLPPVSDQRVGGHDGDGRQWTPGMRSLQIGWVQGTTMIMMDQGACPLGDHVDWPCQVIRLRVGDTVTIGP